MIFKSKTCKKLQQILAIYSSAVIFIKIIYFKGSVIIRKPVNKNFTKFID